MEKLCNNIAKYFFIFLVVLFSIANIFFTVRTNYIVSNDVEYRFGLNPINIIVLIIVVIIICLLNRKDYFGLKTKTYLFALLIIVTALGLYWIFSNPIDFMTYDDSRNCYDAAVTILSGNYEPLSYRSYLNTYPHNIPLVTYFMLIIKLFGEINAITVIRLINLIFVLIGYYYLYKIADRIFNNRKTNLNIISLMFLSLQFVFFSYYVYGNAMSISLSFVSIYYLLKYLENNNTKSLLLSGVTIGFGVAMKNNVMIVLIAEIIYLLIEMFIKKNYKYIILVVLMVFSTFICTVGVIRYWGYKVDYSYDNKLPKICWIAYGFNYDEKHPGSYFDSLERYHWENGYNVTYTEAKAHNFIKGVFEDFSKKPLLIPKFYGEKLLVAWTNPEYGVFSYDHLQASNNLNNINKSIIKGSINNVFNTIWDAVLSLVSIGLLVYVIKRRKQIELIELILAVVFIGGFIFHMFWELKSIYMYHYYLCLLPYAAHGLMLLFNKKE